MKRAIQRRLLRAIPLLAAGLFAQSALAGDAALEAAPSASYAAGTTGGTAAAVANIYSVSTAAGLRAALSSAGSLPKIIKVVGTIDMTDGADFTGASDQASRGVITLPSNTTLIGANASSGIVNGSILIKDVTQVIVRNLKIVAPCDVAPVWDPTDTSTGNWNAAYDAIHVENSTYVWIDHNTITDAPQTDDTLAVENGKTKQCHDGAIDITSASDYVAVTYNVIKQHDKTMLIGGSDSATSDAGKLHVTIANNVFDTLTQRVPRVRYGTIHLFNNYFVGSKSDAVYPNSYSVGAGIASQIISQNNVFAITGASNCAAVVKYPSSDTTGAFKDSGSTLNGATLSGCSVSNAVTATVPYSFSVRPAALAKANALAQAGAGKISTAITGSAAVTVHMLGDSTMTVYTADRRPQMGWGEAVPQFFNSNVTVKNWALGGRSSRSFYYEATRWPAILPQIKAGDYVIIQFGHNDQKYGADYATYGTYAFCSDGSGNGEACSGAADSVDSTVDKSEHSYYQFLKRYVTEVRAAGATPILMTPIVRNYWSGGTITATGQHNFTTALSGETNARGNYPVAMKAVADQYDVPFVDLTSATKAIVLSYGLESAAANLYIAADSTHPQVLFANLIAKRGVEGLKNLNILTDYMVPVTSLIASPGTLAWSNRYLNVSSTKSVTLSAFDLTPASGTVTVVAPSSAYQLSLDNTNWSSSVDISYTNSAFTATLYVKFTPTAVADYSGTISFLLGGATMATSVSVSGAGIEAGAGVDSYATWYTAGTVLTPVTDGLVTADNVTVSNLTATTSKVLAVNGQDTTVARYTATWTSRDNTKYLQFAVRPASGTFTVDTITAYLTTSGGSTVQADMEYSLSADFSSSTKLNASALSFTKDTMSKVLYDTLAVQVPLGSTLYLRIYPWNTAGNTGKSLAVYGVKMSGKATSE